MMTFGVCGTTETAALAAELGYDYFETSVGGLLKPLEDRQAFAEALADVQAAALPCPVVNCFVPGSHPITGPEADLAALEAYVTTTCERANEAAVEVIVFGSGGARRVPDGFDRALANEQLIAFGKMVGPIAEANDVTVVVEPLNQTECNILTTVAECADYVRAVDHPAFRLLVDGYHWLKDDKSTEGIIRNGPLLQHTHIATVPNRRAPGCEPCDFGGFFDALKAGQYSGRLSIEARIENPEEDLPKALETLRQLA